jgi:hypothetical protein
MPSAESQPDLTAEELARVQVSIDAGTVWASVDAGRFAMQLIDAGRCKRAPGVLAMWREEDDRYRAIYSQAEVDALTEMVLRELPKSLERVTEEKAELDFLVASRDARIRIGVEKELHTPAPGFMALLASVPLALASNALWAMVGRSAGLVAALVSVTVVAIVYLRAARARSRAHAWALREENALRAAAGRPLKDGGG